MKNRDLYPSEWEDTIRPAVLKRDCYKCTVCKVSHRAVGYYNSQGTFIESDEFMRQWATKNGFKVVKIHLQVAHINQDTFDNSDANLCSMCPKCHLKHDHEFNRLKRISKKQNSSSSSLGLS